MAMSNDTSHTSYVDRVREDTQKYVRRLLSENEQLRVTVAQLESEVGRVKQELSQRQQAARELELAVERVRAESEQYLAQYAEVEMHNANLANLYVASYQLHGTLERETVLGSMQEIIVNLVGSEEFAICEIEGDAVDAARA
jgi:predicted RNase H-like nuclease (RuvC/YqgF family)